MAESLSHRLNEYLRNGQANEDMNAPHARYEGRQENIQLGKQAELNGQRMRNHDRRSGSTRSVNYLFLSRDVFHLSNPLNIYETKPSVRACDNIFATFYFPVSNLTL